LRACDSLVAPKSKKNAEDIARLYSSIDVGLVFVEAKDYDRLKEYIQIFKEYGIEALSRITIEVHDWLTAIGNVRAYSQKYDIVAVKPKTAEAARLAARDPRVTVVQLPPSMARYMDRSQALMLREGSAVIEVKLLPLLYHDDPRRTLRGIMIITRRAVAYEAPLVVGSGAREVWEVWHPRQVIALLSSFGLPVSVCKSIVLGNCRLAL
jgi:ribonuclease P/MRP protein subunit RPP1